MTAIEKLKLISPKELAFLGMQEVAYVKRVVGDHDEAAWAIHAADGTQVALVPQRDLAIATIRQHDLEPMSVH
jgi:hypothetical protein